MLKSCRKESLFKLHYLLAMKLTFIMLVVCLSFSAESQNGFVKLRNDSVMKGYLKYTFSDIGRGIEFWRSKKDKAPLRLRMSDVYEYAINDDTFRVLQNYKPFPDRDLHFDIVEANVLLRGKVDLMVHLRNSSLYTGSRASGVDRHIFVLQNPTSKYIRGIPSGEKFFEALEDFIPYGFLRAYATLYGDRVHYDDIPQIVRLYNADKLVDSLSMKHLHPKEMVMNQLALLIENADELLGITEAQLLSNEHPASILGGWKMIAGKRLASTPEEKVILFEVNWGVLMFAISDETGLVDFMAVGPRKSVTKREVAKFLDKRYKGQSAIVKSATKTKIAFQLSESEDVYYVLVMAFPGRDN